MDKNIKKKNITCKKCNKKYSSYKQLLYQQWEFKKSYYCPKCKNRIR